MWMPRWALVKNLFLHPLNNNWYLFSLSYLEHWVLVNQTDDYVFHAASWMPWTLGQPSTWKSILTSYCLDLFIPGNNFVHLLASEGFIHYSFSFLEIVGCGCLSMKGKEPQVSFLWIFGCTAWKLRLDSFCANATIKELSQPNNLNC